jgi:hypothetical protein
MEKAMSSERQIDANRRNAQKSPGPRTEEGKERSRYNAVTHGMTAQFDALPGEEAEALAGRIDDWTADLKPRSQLEYDLIEQAARASWQLDRVELAEVARVTANILKATSGENAAAEIEAARALGARLLGELPGSGDDSISPAQIVLTLESSTAGCHWLLDRWAELRALLEQGQAWQSSDKLKAIRLLGRQPLNALEGSQVAQVFLACHTIDPSGGALFHEIEDTLTPDQWNIAKELLAKRPFDLLRPRDQAEAREALMQIVERAVKRLDPKADAHRQRDELDAATAPARLAVDLSRKGELLRNYAAKCQRALFRALDQFCKVRKTAKTGKSLPAAVAVETSTEPVALVDRGNTQNEPNFGVTQNTDARSVAPVDEEITQNEPNFGVTPNTDNEPVALVDPQITQNEPNFAEPENTFAESVAAAELGNTQNEPNLGDIQNTDNDSAAPVDQRITQNEPNFAEPENTVAESIAAAELGNTQNEPNLGDIQNTDYDSVAPVDQRITQNEPNFVSSYTANEISQDNDKARVLFREGRSPRASPRVRCRRSSRGDLRLPLNGARPNRACGAGRRVRAESSSRFHSVPRASPRTASAYSRSLAPH